MKAISLRQPWAELILSGRKTIETRKWNTRFRGEFLLHSASAVNPDAMRAHGFSELPTGCIVGRAVLVDVKKYPSLESFNADEQLHCARISDASAWTKPRYGFILRDVARVRNVPFKGRLGWFDVDDSLLSD